MNNKILLTQDRLPMSDSTAMTTPEIKIMMGVHNIKPKKGCATLMTLEQNSTLGCYIVNPDG